MSLECLTCSYLQSNIQNQSINRAFRKMRSCTFYIRASDSPPNPDDIKRLISSIEMDDKVRGVRELIKCVVADQSFPPLIMNIISSVIPVVQNSPEIRKAMLLYWEVIEKSKSPTDKTLKDQMFLACNSLRNDLLCHNEYMRGRTLRLVSRIMHKGVIEPLSSAIVANLDHKSSYVRRNAVVCLYQVYVNFGSDIIGDIDQEIQKLLKNETDLSTKRNAFLLLHKTNPQKAMTYIQQQVSNQTLQQIGDILKLAILKVFKVKCKEDPSQKTKILKTIRDFSINSTESVTLECAITSTAISNSVSTIKSSLYAYVNILAKTNQLNVKKIILDKLALICKNSSYLEDDLVEDLLKSLETPSFEIKQKLLQIITSGATMKTSKLIVRELQKEAKNHHEEEYIDEIVRTLEYLGLKFPSIHDVLFTFVTEKVFRVSKLSAFSAISIVNLIKHILLESNTDESVKIRDSIIEKFPTIESNELIRAILNLLGSCLDNPQLVIKAINIIGVTIGSLPIQAAKDDDEKDTEQETENKVKSPENKKIFKTVILEDGSYATQLVNISEEEQQRESFQQAAQKKMSFRNQLAQDSIMGATFARNIGKLLYRIRKSEHFNKYACSILMILCSLLRNYSSRIHEVDQACIDQITLLIRKITDPQSFISEEDESLMQESRIRVHNFEREKKLQVIEKNPEDMIVFRQLKKNAEDITEIDIEDEEINDFTEAANEQTDYISRLKSIVQLTGHFDPLYAESFVKINKYDVFFEIILVNTSKSNLLNIQIEFSSTSEILVLEKAQSVNLRPNQMAKLRSQIRFVNEFGSVYGYINFDNQAGLEQPYLITEEIKIDFMQFIVPGQISELEFKSQWLKAGNQEKLSLKFSQAEINFKRIIDKCEKTLHVLAVQKYQDLEEQYFLNVQFYGKSKLGEDFFINAALFKGEVVEMNSTIRSKDKAVLDIITNKMASLKIEEQE